MENSIYSDNEEILLSEIKGEKSIFYNERNKENIENLFDYMLIIMKTSLEQLRLENIIRYQNICQQRQKLMSFLK